MHAALGSPWMPMVALLSMAAAAGLAVLCSPLACVAVVLALLWLLAVVTSPCGGRVWAPRLLASVVVGWLALSTSEWAWRLVTAADAWAHALVASLALGLLAYGYVHLAEVRRHAGGIGDAAWGRACQIWLVGASHALSSGIVGMALASPTIACRAGAVCVGPLHIIWPGPVLQLSAFALALGIIAQTLWERDAVTEPL